MNPTNQNRGECTLTIGGTTYTGKVTLDTLKRIENLTGKSFFALVRNLATPEELSVSVLIGVVELALKNGPDAKRVPAADDIFADGLLALMGNVSLIVQAAMGNVRATETTPQ